jgi:streptomycin 6-kinase
MLKLTPDTRLAVAEATSLTEWAASDRVPSVWRYDAERGALLLEAIPREEPLSETGLHVPLPEVAGLIDVLHRTGTPAVGNGIVSLTERVDFI